MRKQTQQVSSYCTLESHLLVPEAAEGAAAVLLAELAHEPRLALRHRRRRGDVHRMMMVMVVTVGRRRLPAKEREGRRGISEIPIWEVNEKDSREW